MFFLLGVATESDVIRAFHFLIKLLCMQDVARLVRLLIRFYSPHAHHHVEAFNLRPEEFDFDKLMKETPRE